MSIATNKYLLIPILLCVIILEVNALCHKAFIRQKQVVRQRLADRITTYEKSFRDRTTIIERPDFLMELRELGTLPVEFIEKRNPSLVQTIYSYNQNLILSSKSNKETINSEIESVLALERQNFAYKQARKEEQIKRQQLQMNIGTLLLLLLGASGYFIYRQYKHQKQINANLLTTQLQLEKTNHRLSRFAYSVSHDIMGRLEQILSASNSVEADELLTPAAEAYYYKSRASAIWLRNYCSELLTWSKEKEVANKEPLLRTNVKVLVEDILRTYKSELRQYNFDVQIGDLPMIKMAAPPLKQVLHNLIDNAIVYKRSSSSKTKNRCHHRRW